MTKNKRTTHDRRKKSAPFYLFSVAMYIFIFAALCWVCMKNIEPYHLATKQMFRIGAEPTRIIELLAFRFETTTSWLVATIMWAVLQGFQIGYLLYTHSKDALGLILRRNERHHRYTINDSDDEITRGVKRQYNRLPLQFLVYLKLGCIFAYVVEFLVNTNAFPLASGGTWGLVVALASDWSRINFSNFGMILITLFAAEALVFALWIFGSLILEYTSDKGSNPGYSYAKDQGRRQG